MYTISCEAHFDAAHFLFGYSGACKNLHGHRWKICVYVSGDKLIDKGEYRGMVVDFNDVKSILNEITERFDHKFIVEKDTLRSATIMMLEEEDFDMAEVDFRPTAENFAKYIFDECKKSGITPSKVRVFESENTCAEYKE